MTQYIVCLIRSEINGANCLTRAIQTACVEHCRHRPSPRMSTMYETTVIFFLMLLPSGQQTLIISNSTYLRDDNLPIRCQLCVFFEATFNNNNYFSLLKIMSGCQPRRTTHAHIHITHTANSFGRIKRQQNISIHRLATVICTPRII